MKVMFEVVDEVFYVLVNKELTEFYNEFDDFEVFVNILRNSVIVYIECSVDTLLKRLREPHECFVNHGIGTLFLPYGIFKVRIMSYIINEEEKNKLRDRLLIESI